MFLFLHYQCGSSWSGGGGGGGGGVYFLIKTHFMNQFIMRSLQCFTKTLFIFYIFSTNAFITKRKMAKRYYVRSNNVGRMALTNYISHTILHYLYLVYCLKNYYPAPLWVDQYSALVLHVTNLY
ncbi:hypothetical protein CW304_15720 [Bacillus sp. UFRGS-B20]|nr:hypothetical protein CW304_15720 [Bacillus sp. UFRGS-B20]